MPHGSAANYPHVTDATVAPAHVGHLVPWVRRSGPDLSAIAGPDAFWLHTPVELRGKDLTTIAEFTVSAGQRIPFVLTHAPSHLPRPQPVDGEKAIADTETFWTSRMSRCRYEGQWPQEVRRSLLLLKALTYAPTGGVLAAATTSLPERIGGVRNWDYRYCWLRDAAFTLQALLGTGYTAEAAAWREWLLRAVASDPGKLQIMYAVDGARRLPEHTLDWLSGYEGSAPVRIGNAAADQLQLDVWGAVLDTLHLARDTGLTITLSDTRNWPYVGGISGGRCQSTPPCPVLAPQRLVEKSSASLKRPAVKDCDACRCRGRRQGAVPLAPSPTVRPAGARARTGCSPGRASRASTR
ncbi:glycoside hydrolase family 15 protein [Streptomyces sp. NBC_00286]|uniref:glycoside hydrolase family 15 protein n=1 Tax=Streptomyces sp. NBC_00286 TaxID=2975701 RepID=UPI002E282A59|nr:glycoside hydrolase family 15 protein [Streptomyces sp. NBC_00286]